MRVVSEQRSFAYREREQFPQLKIFQLCRDADEQGEAIENGTMPRPTYNVREVAFTRMEQPLEDMTKLTGASRVMIDAILGTRDGDTIRIKRSDLIGLKHLIHATDAAAIDLWMFRHSAVP